MLDSSSAGNGVSCQTTMPVQKQRPMKWISHSSVSVLPTDEDEGAGLSLTKDHTHTGIHKNKMNGPRY